MKVAILLGRGIEGCGVTRYAIEFQYWLKKNGHECDVFASSDKKFMFTQQSDIISFPNDAISGLRNKLNDNYDVVFYQSLPAKPKGGHTKGHSIEYSELFFTELVQGVLRPKKVAIQLDHNIQSLSRNYKMWETMGALDAVFTHSLTSTFAKKMAEFNPDVPVLKMGLGFDFDSLLPFWQKKQIPKLTYFSRYAPFKDPKRMLDLFPLLQKADIITELLGVQRTIGAAKEFYIPNLHNIQEMQVIDGEHVTRYINGKANHQPIVKDLSKIWAYQKYERAQGLQQLSEAMFGADFYNMPAEMYGDNMEFAMCEIPAVGTIPVFDKHWADNCMHDMGFLFKDFKDFAIYSDRDNLQAGVDEMASLVKDSVARNKRRERCFEVAKAHCDSDIAFGKIIEQL